MKFLTASLLVVFFYCFFSGQLYASEESRVQDDNSNRVIHTAYALIPRGTFEQFKKKITKLLAEESNNEEISIKKVRVMGCTDHFKSFLPRCCLMILVTVGLAVSAYKIINSFAEDSPCCIPSDCEERLKSALFRANDIASLVLPTTSPQINTICQKLLCNSSALFFNCTGKN